MLLRSLLPMLAVTTFALGGCESTANVNSPSNGTTLSEMSSSSRSDSWAGPVTPTIFKSGLQFPRGLAFGPDGALYVAEAGTGGTTATTPAQCEQVVPPVGPYTNGNTARISRIDRHGVMTTVVEGLPSARNALGDILGVSDIAFLDNTMYALLGGGGCSHGNADVPASVIRVRHSGGSWSRTADLSAYQANNHVAQPEEDDFEPDGSWYSMISSGAGLVAVEPNHGEMVRINPRNGDVTRIVDFSATLGHIVPTVVAQRRGAFYVSNLGVFPEAPGTQKILRVSRRGRISEVATGFSKVLGLEFDESGRLYVLETSTQGDFPTPETGRVIRLDRKGHRDVIAEKLFFPTGMTFGPDGDLYVSNNGFGPPIPGSILQIHIGGAHDRHDDLDMEHDED